MQLYLLVLPRLAGNPCVDCTIGKDSINAIVPEETLNITTNQANHDF